MDPNSLMPPASHLGYPAPFWFLEFFKVLGFILHMVPMHLWYGGILTAMILMLVGKGSEQRAARRLMNAMPVLVALGINFGIVPLLFTQVAYHQFYYPAGILIAWPWISVIGLLIIAYYGVYIYTIGLRKGTLTPVKRAAGWISSVMFVVIGFLFANNFSLMANPGRWGEMLMRSSVAGAPTGLALNTGDPTFFPRWLMMFGMALATTAVFMAVDAAYFTKKDAVAYRAGLGKFTAFLYALGALIYAVMGNLYIFNTLDNAVAEVLWSSGGLSVLTIITGILPAIVLVLMAIQVKGLKKPLVLAAAIGQALVLAANAISRQVVQNIETGRYVDVSAGIVNTQWSTLILFLLVFIAGVAIIIWMLRQIWNIPAPQRAVDL